MSDSVATNRRGEMPLIPQLRAELDRLELNTRWDSGKLILTTDTLGRPARIHINVTEAGLEERVRRSSGLDDDSVGQVISDVALRLRWAVAADDGVHKVDSATFDLWEWDITRSPAHTRKARCTS